MTKIFTRNAVLLAGAVTGLAISAAPAVSAEPQTHRIVFRVYGPQSASLVFGPQAGSLINVTYKTPTTAVNAKLVPVPWNLSFQAKGNDAALAGALRLSATRPESGDGVNGFYVCEISVDGELRSRDTSDLQDGSSLQCSINDSDDAEAESDD